MGGEPYPEELVPGHFAHLVLLPSPPLTPSLAPWTLQTTGGEEPPQDSQDHTGYPRVCMPPLLPAQPSHPHKNLFKIQRVVSKVRHVPERRAALLCSVPWEQLVDFFGYSATPSVFCCNNDQVTLQCGSPDCKVWRGYCR